MKTKIPIMLIWSRLALGLLILSMSMMKINYYNIFAVALLSIGLLTDILDGIIARKLHISTQNLRRLDSTIDQVFFIAVALATYIQCPVFFKTHAVPLVILIGLEALTYLICFIKFKKEIATHSIGAKLWTLLLFATLVEIMVHCQSGLLFGIFFYAGIVTRLEIIAIILILKEWTNDVPTFYHAVQLRKGKKIKRHKLFNG